MFFPRPLETCSLCFKGVLCVWGEEARPLDSTLGTEKDLRSFLNRGLSSRWSPQGSHSYSYVLF